MANNTNLKPCPSPSISQPAPTSPVIPLWRTHEYGQNLSVSPAPAGSTGTQQGEDEKSCIICEFCGTAVGFRDEEIGGFTSKHWKAHRLTCYPLRYSSSTPGQSSSDGPVVIYTPESTAVALSHPPTKRRRVKRTEEERINYLRADPYVARFEAYRVLCASCNKWIRLRPNSTYCSIPWDAHKRSCLAKKVSLTEHVPLIEHQMALAVSPGRGASFRGVQPMLPHHSVSPVFPTPTPIFAQSNNTQPHNHTSDNPSFHGRNPSNYAPTHQSQRQNAEQRAATLRADPLIREVETIAVENPISQTNIAQGISESDLAAFSHHMPMPLYTSHTLTSTYNPELQMLFRNNVQPSYHPDVTHDENTNRPTFSNAYTTQGISESGVAVANHLMPGYRVGNSHTLTSTHNPSLQTLSSSVNNVQSSYYPGIPTVGSIAQSTTMAVEVPTSANYSLSLDQNTNMYSRMSDDNTVNWHCNLSGCQYVSWSKRDMKRHCSSLNHGGRREHQCQYCGKAFGRLDTLRRHVKATGCLLRQAELTEEIYRASTDWN